MANNGMFELYDADHKRAQKRDERGEGVKKSPQGTCCTTKNIISLTRKFTQTISG